jgi:hypothetical protein
MNIDQPHTDDLDLRVAHTHKKQMIEKRLATLQEPVDPATFHQYVLPARTPVELNSHAIDEYWWFTSGTPLITL